MSKRWLTFLLVALLSFTLIGCGIISKDEDDETAAAPAAADTTAPTAPTGLTATGGCSKVDLSWTASTDDTAVTGYKIYSSGTYVATVGTTTYSHINLSTLTAYSYTVSAVDAAGNESAKSTAASATTLDCVTTWGAAVGVAYSVEGAGSTPLGGGTISVDGAAVGTTASDGSFNIAVSNPKTSSEIKLTANGYNTVTKTANVSTSEAVYLYTMPLDLKKTLLSPTLGKALLPPPPTILSDSGGIAEIEISMMNLNRSLAVTVTPFTSSKAIPAITDLKTTTGQVTKGFTIIGGADVTIVDSSTQAELNETDFTVGSSAKVKPRTKGFIGQYTAEDIYYFSGQASTGNEAAQLANLYKIYLYYYSKATGTWTQAGAGTIAKSDNYGKDGQGNTVITGQTYTLMPATAGVTTPSIQSYAYVLESPETFVANVSGKAGTCTGGSVTTGFGNVQITAGDDTDVTAASGQYTVQPTISFNSPMVQVCASLVGYYDKCESVDITMNTGNGVTPAQKDICMEKIPILPIVKGLVSDSSTQAGIGGADVTLTTSSVLTGDQIKIVNGTMAEVGLDPNATYTWSISVDGGSTWNTLKTGLGDVGYTFNIATDVDTTALADMVANIGTGTINQMGVIILKVTVAHANGFTESATGSVYVNIVLPQINSITSTGGLDVWGGQAKGFYFVDPTAMTTQPTSYEWELSVQWDGSYYGGGAGISNIVTPTVVSTGDTLTIQQIAGFLTNNVVSLIKPIGADYINNCIPAIGAWDGVKNWLITDQQYQNHPFYNVDVCLTPYIIDWVALKITAKALDANGTTVLDSKTTDATLDDFTVEVSELVIQANTNTAPFFKTEANDSGNYEFTNLPVALVGVTSSAKAEGYYGSDPWANAATIGSGAGQAAGTGTGGALALNDVVTIDLSLDPVPPAAVTSYSEDFSDCTDWTLSSYPNAYSGQKVTQSTTVKWQCVSAAENANTKGYSSLAVPGTLLNIMNYPEEGLFYIDANNADTAVAYPVALLSAHGTDAYYAWFGDSSTQCFTDNSASNTSGTAFSGTLTSPAIALTDFSYATLDYWSWFEAESVDIAQYQYDQMIVELKVTDATVKVNDYITLTQNQWYAIDTMNPKSEPSAYNQNATKNYSSGGVNAVPIWLHKLVNLNPLAGHTIQVRFLFDTKDSLFNAFRGWGVDDLKITNTDSGLPFKKVNVSSSYLTKPSR